MTVRKPLFINSDGDLQEMTDAQVVLHQQKAIYQYSLDPSALLTVVANSGANMASITDTRLTTGASAVLVRVEVTQVCKLQIFPLVLPVRWVIPLM